MLRAAAPLFLMTGFLGAAAVGFLLLALARLQSRKTALGADPVLVLPVVACLAWVALAGATMPWVILGALLSVAVGAMLRTPKAAHAGTAARSTDAPAARAGIECLAFCLGAQVLAVGIPGWPGDFTWLLAGTVVGWLVFVWPPAALDPGPGGRAMARALALAAALPVWWFDVLPAAAVAILLAGIWTDAGYTAAIRLRAGPGSASPWNVLAARRGRSWMLVVCMVLCVGWQVPLAWVALRLDPTGWLLVPLAAAPYALLVLRARSAAHDPVGADPAL
ncbi:MAG: hypothetical protein KF911_02400 [Pseudomonadales bacterium]|nr:hypothetical protein [Pseudomonadales bacterium]